MIRDQIEEEARAAHGAVAALDDDGVTRALARAAELGGELVDGPRRLPRGTRIAVCHDPQGAEYGLRERGPSPVPPLRAVT